MKQNRNGSIQQPEINGVRGLGRSEQCECRTRDENGKQQQQQQINNNIVYPRKVFRLLSQFSLDLFFRQNSSHDFAIDKQFFVDGSISLHCLCRYSLLSHGFGRTKKKKSIGIMMMSCAEIHLDM